MNLSECERIFNRAILSKTESEFYYLIEPLFSEYEILSLELGRGSTFWRARIIDRKIFSNVDDLDYPPSEAVSDGRLNDRGVPFFYVSTNQETALAEVGPSNGQDVQIAGFKIEPNKFLRVVVIGEYSNVQKNGYMHFLGKDPGSSILKMLNQLPRKEALKRIYIDRFFSHILRDTNAKSNNYMFSRVLAKAILGKNPSDGIAFPSVKDRGGFNIGIKSEASDDCFHNVSCIITKINATRTFGLIDFEIVGSAKYIDEYGNFIWNRPANKDTTGMYNMSKNELDRAIKDGHIRVLNSGQVDKN